MMYCFFKQKTAYELRISDWSSDVCSSDLIMAEKVGLESRLRLITDAVPALIAYIDRDERYQFVNRGYADWVGRRKEGVLGRKDIGRETCRERVCHTVSDGWAACHKKKINKKQTTQYRQIIDGTSKI